MNTLVTGGNGFLGHHLIPRLQAEGAAVRVLTLPGEDTTWLEQRNVAVFHGDVRKAETLVAPMDGVETVLNLAGMMGVWKPMEAYQAVNVAGTESVCRAAIQAGVRRLVHVSSWTVYGMGMREPAREDFPLNPFPEPYGVTKMQSEAVIRRLVASHGLPAVIVRPDTFFGPGDRLHFARMADRLAAGKGIVIGSGSNTLPFAYVADVAHGIILASQAKTATGQAYNIASDRPMTQEEMLQAIAREIGAEPPRIHVPFRMLYAAATVIEKASLVANPRMQPPVTRLGVNVFGAHNPHSIEKAQAELGYTPRVRLEEGVTLAAKWYLEQQPADPNRVQIMRGADAEGLKATR